GGPGDAETAPAGRSSEAGDIDAVASTNNAFAFDLYRQLAKEEGNLFFSPYSLSIALAMVYGGASGQTAAQLAQALHIELPADTFHRAVSELARALEAPNDAYDLSVANALWGQKGYPFRSEFLELTSSYYQAGLHEVDYTSASSREAARRAINAWVEEQTQGKIRNLIQPEDLSDLTRLVLTNAIYFKGAWEAPFHPDATRPMPFHLAAGATVDVPTMHQSADFLYAENETVQVLELPYAGGKLSMVVVLPKEGGLQALEETIDPQQVQAWLAQGSKREVEVYLPRFTLAQRVVLNDVLQALGVVDAFDPTRADFSGMAEDRDLYLSQVIHQSFIEVHEEGTEAAAATGIGMRITSLPANPPPVFRVDRPFIFLIRDGSTGTILFMGRVADPRG
ncbi:MAG TPA: serpin family protein, partial [Limnochorda sp.]